MTLSGLLAKRRLPLWVLPTHKRPEKLRRFIDSMSSTDLRARVMLVIWGLDPRLKDYNKIKLPGHWQTWISKERLCGEKMNAVYELYADEDFYGLLTDDVQLGTPGMLQELRREAVHGRFAWPDDGVHGARLATHPVAPAAMLHALGFWAHPKFPHWGLDKVLTRVAEALDICCYREDLKLIVRHPDAGFPEEIDETYREAEPLNAAAIDNMAEFERVELPRLIVTAKRRFGTKHDKTILASHD